MGHRQTAGRTNSSLLNDRISYNYNNYKNSKHKEETGSVLITADLEKLVLRRKHVCLSVNRCEVTWWLPARGTAAEARHPAELSGTTLTGCARSRGRPIPLRRQNLTQFHKNMKVQTIQDLMDSELKIGAFPDSVPRLGGSAQAQKTERESEVFVTDLRVHPLKQPHEHAGFKLSPAGL